MCRDRDRCGSFSVRKCPGVCIQTICERQSGKSNVGRRCLRKVRQFAFLFNMLWLERQLSCLVLSYEEGKTLFDCILEGIHIPEQVIQDVEEAREYARSKGLNPRDIH